MHLDFYTEASDTMLPGTIKTVTNAEYPKKKGIYVGKKYSSVFITVCDMNVSGLPIIRNYTRSILQMHMTRHTGKLCKCPQDGCVFAGRSAAELKTHYLTHSDTKPFACTHCEYKGKTKQQLERYVNLIQPHHFYNRHATIHENIKKYQCSICQFSSRLSSHLKRHMRLHTGAKPFCCPHCKYRCNNLVHLVTEHGDTFQTGSEAATYVAGIYEASDDSTFIDARTDLKDRESTSEPNIYRLECNEDAAVIPLTTMQSHTTNSSELFSSSVNTSASGSVSVENKGQDELFPLYIVSKDGVCVENQGDTWNMVGSYDVEESGTLVPFDSDDEKLFGEHFQ
ncbi:zinc finger protein [Holotrichia oblita]|uniref:Zinc finger protein n=1 Tax=Holotrichia oblita TaxID=644536 RepID=A0ACB9T4R5_HOLOL|nr:zinc finger protein [Holotrichia oblita]